MENQQQYINQFTKYPLSFLAELDQENQGRKDVQPNIGKQAGALLDWLITLTGAKRVLELGTCLGFSTIYLALALQKTRGRLTAIEYSEDLFKETAENLKEAGVRSSVDLIHGNAAEVIHNLNGPFDLILQDSDKRLYLPMLEDCIDLLRSGGILVSDDTLFPAMDVPPQYKENIQAYNQAVFNDSRLQSILLPLGDGITLSIKK